MAKMPPPGTGAHDAGGVAIIIGSPKKRTPPGMSDQPQGSGKASAEEAGVVLSSEHCIDCRNYHHDTGECDKVDGNYEVSDGCSEYFTPADDETSEGEPAESDAADPEPPTK